MGNPIQEEEVAIKELSQLSRERIMKERPILFNTEMVKAVLSGRKTQTRRVVKPQPECHYWEILRGYKQEAKLITAQDGLNVKFIDSIPDGTMNARRKDEPLWVRCPYGQVGDRLWIRETFYATHIDEKSTKDHGQIYYKADDNPYVVVSWKPSIHMPRWASRINLEITNIRVERVQDISDKDSLKEGISLDYSPPAIPVIPNGLPRAKFGKLWDSINEKRGYGWKANPWVWVVEFKVI